MEMEGKISKIIIEYTMKDWIENIVENDVVIVGAGPSGLTAAKYLAEKGLKTIVLERRLSYGGGMGGGGMLFHKIVVGKEAKQILDEMNIRAVNVNDEFYVVDTYELMTKLAYNAIEAGAKIIHGIQVEDVIYRENPLRIIGVVILWSAIALSGLHVDPLFIESKAVIDATGHGAEVVSIASKKIPELNINVKGEKSAYAELSEKLVVEYTGRIVPGLYATGMSIAAINNLPRMGPIFSGMLLSGKKIAEIVSRDIISNKK
ncbi:MAG: sulfide-dependent adenosine diphosphate thiazole synthase [Candidatus Methanomethylicia archaeon]